MSEHSRTRAGANVNVSRPTHTRLVHGWSQLSGTLVGRGFCGGVISALLDSWVTLLLRQRGDRASADFAVCISDQVGCNLFPDCCFGPEDKSFLRLVGHASYVLRLACFSRSREKGCMHKTKTAGDRPTSVAMFMPRNKLGRYFRPTPLRFGTSTGSKSAATQIMNQTRMGDTVIEFEFNTLLTSSSMTSWRWLGRLILLSTIMQ